MVKKKVPKNHIKGSAHIFYHVIVAALSAAIALSLPFTISFIAKKVLAYWSLIGDEKIFVVIVELALATFVILLSYTVGRGWEDRKFSNMAKKAGLVFVSSNRSILTRRKIKKLKEEIGFSRDVMMMGSTGFRTFVDPKGDLHHVIQNCREAKIMFLNPFSDGAKARAKSILNPDITPESFREQIEKSIDFLKGLKSLQKNVRLKLYQDTPLLKMVIIGDYIWVQHYHPGLDVQSMPEYVFKHDQNTGSLYAPFYQYFLTRWNNPDLPEYDLDTDELIYRNVGGKEIRREKFNETGLEARAEVGLSNDRTRGNHLHEEATPLPLLAGLGDCGWSEDVSADQRRILTDSLHSRGKEIFLLSSKGSVCQTIGWTNPL
jgi:hypothetical protein